MQRADDDLSLATLGALRLRGADCVRFLQGQLSQNVELVSPSRSALAGYHNPQGRVIALLRLIALGDADLIAVMPRELIPVVAARLARFVLRSKVTLADESDRWDVRGIIDRDGARADWPRSTDGQIASGEARIVCVGVAPVRWLCIAPRAGNVPEVDADSQREWRALEIAAGQPQVYAATSETFVAQMLNLDLIGAIAFDKGCYTGQEIIARAHYRGRMRRRMQRFRTTTAIALQPGDRGRLSDGREFQVVQSAATAAATEFLAVTVQPGADSDTPPDESGAHFLQLPLPYELPA
jgi:folate-binding protein YgfZ